MQGASRVQDAWFRSRAVRELATWPRMRALLRAAYGRDPFPFQTLNFQRGSEQAIHSDAAHFHSEPPRFMCGVWIALEDIRPEAGPLAYHPGSHRLPVMSMRDAGVNHAHPTHEDYARVYEPRLRDRLEQSGLPVAHAILPKGWAFVWAANLAHGGSAIQDPAATRRSLVVHNFFEGCVYYTPITSDEERGRLSLRLPPNIRTGGWGWPTRNGQPLWVGGRLVADALKRDLRRRPVIYE